MYLNVDAGTIRPQEHGEVFVTKDGIETDQDLGHYERFLHQSLTKNSYITTGQIYQEVIRKERTFEYSGEDVEAIPHVTDEITRRIKLAGTSTKSEIVLVEMGGTVGEYQNGIFFEATRIYKLKNPNDLLHIHVTYLPFLSNIGELKSKPAQTSVHILNGMGIQPDVVVARSEKVIDKRRLDRLALFCNIDSSRIFSAPDVESIYQIPLIFSKMEHNLAETSIKLLGLKSKKYLSLKNWENMVKRSNTKFDKCIKIALVGKYFKTGDYKMSDAYVSVVEALKHASWNIGINLKMEWINSEDIEINGVDSLKKYDGIIVPQGWGSRGTEGKIKAIKFARENKIPYLGLCFGMQMAAIEFARNILKIKGANSQEINPKTNNPIIHIMPDQEKYLANKQYGGTIRLGSWPCLIKKGSLLEKAYKVFGKVDNPPWFEDKGEFININSIRHKNNTIVYERHRHRYEFNNKFKKSFEKNGLLISGTSPDGKLVEAIEIKDHPFFIGTQFHPEYISRPLTPHPIFVSFLNSASNIAGMKRK